MDYSELLEKYKLLQSENELLRAEIVKLNTRLMKYSTEENGTEKIYETIISYEDIGVALVTNNSSAKEKIDLFLTLFKGRENVCAKRWIGELGCPAFAKRGKSK